MTRVLEIQSLGSNLITDQIYVRTGKVDRYCVEEFEGMQPSNAANTNLHVCLNCGGLITNDDMFTYNRFYGFSGADDGDDEYFEEESE